MDRESICTVLRAHRDGLRDLGVRSLSIFGSAARGEADEASDVDLLVELERPVGLLDFAQLRRLLSQWLGRPVDLATPAALHPQMRDEIMREAVRAA